jgi:hypothetical protein
MKLTKTLIIVLLILISCFNIHTQDRSIKKINLENSVKIDKDILYSRVTLLENNGEFLMGFIVGLKEDTILIHSNNEIFNVPIENLNSISIDVQSKAGMKGLAIGGILGIYMGNLIFYQTDFEPTAYWDDSDIEVQAAVSLLVFGFVGGGIGYLIDVNTSGGIEVFDFSGNDREKHNEYERLKKFLTGEKITKSIHISVQLSQVNTRYSKLPEDFYFGYRGVTSFNLLRRVQMTYSLFRDLGLGGAISWFGEPSFFWSTSIGGSSIRVTQTFEGVGYYAIAAYSPFSSALSNSFSWVIGAGVGMGNVDYEFHRIESGGFPDYFQDTTSTIIHEKLLSALIYTEFDLYLYEEFSLGISVDYVYIPKEIPGIPELNISEGNLGNFSFGLTIGLHF